VIGITVLAAVFIAYSLVAARLDRWSITAPMVFVAAGVAIGIGAPEWLGAIGDPEPVKLIAELTLALLLFADASTLRWTQVRQDEGLPARLLLIGFPLTVVAGIGLGLWLVPTAGLAAAALAASMLAPTDAALGLGVFTNESVPARIRRALNIESGLNDGMATPLVTLFLALLVAEEGVGPKDWLAESAKELGLAVLVALVVGAVGGWLVTAAHNKGWTSALSDRLAALALALLAYGGALAIGGNGFVAAFGAGLVFAAASKDVLREAIEFTEDLGLFASFLVWALFGALLLAPQLTEGASATAIAYAVLSLTVVRMLPVAISTIGTGLRPASRFFMGWFGPRGLASVVFTLIAFESLQEGGFGTSTLIEVATWTIFLSVLAHGITAGALARWYGARVAEASVEQLEPGSDLGSHMPRALIRGWKTS
jgi:NhaP-type Na+/H+ or K+/H+ antiporter